jgi:hypothetical protein
MVRSRSSRGNVTMPSRHPEARQNPTHDSEAKHKADCRFRKVLQQV